MFSLLPHRRVRFVLSIFIHTAIVVFIWLNVPVAPKGWVCYFPYDELMVVTIPRVALPIRPGTPPGLRIWIEKDTTR